MLHMRTFYYVVGKTSMFDKNANSIFLNCIKVILIQYYEYKILPTLS